MNKHIFKTSELPILAAIAILLKLAALIEAPASQIQDPINRLNMPDYALSGIDNISLYVLDYGYLITQTGLYEHSPSIVCISEDSPEFQYYSISSLDYLPQMEQTAAIVTSPTSPANFHTAGLSIAYGTDCQ